ncbi:YicC family protein [Niallia circulans]|uniref:YicC family protein n=2 Tax=Bacillaceae TaxID=186817 RepID=A0A268FGI9_NIACI|nr:YicC/YloC family endoribonuclease [Niallia circulans]AYV65948.1 YicC family protein [Niallia circulans]AYV71236.1 YicC family protein [Niallia circulans]NRG26450.1 YicC family protein [Niallia circulans]PAD84427.1 YicC family protein [Niallia circulans]QJX64772.1 YicC family protein [Niallia circulans]
MMKSMTGFGRATKQYHHSTLHIEIKSVNHRFSDQIIRMPKQFLYLEDQIKKIISNYIHRGRIEVFVTLEDEDKKGQEIIVDWPLLDQYYQLLHQLKDKYSIKEPISLRDLLNQEECFQIVERELDMEELSEVLLATMEEAVVQLNRMRTIEGEELSKDLESNLKQIEKLVANLQSLAPEVIAQYREKLKARIESYLTEPIDEARLITEVAIFADKADINEELVRLHSHIRQFYQIMEENNPIGRKLDFLLQEMNREVNTIGSKANSADIGANVVEMKSCLEKMKEQIQNIE